MTPLHPLVVHLPLALAVVVPVLAIGALFYAWRRGISRRAWAVVFLLQAGLVAGGFAALSTGEADEHRVERVVAESAIERHEESGERFVWASAGVLGLMLLPLLTRRATLRRATIGVAAAGSVATVALAVDTGHKGGELVYENGAALAYVNTDAATGASRAARGRDGGGPGELARHGDGEGDDDDDDD